MLQETDPFEKSVTVLSVSDRELSNNSDISFQNWQCPKMLFCSFCISTFSVNAYVMVIKHL